MAVRAKLAVTAVTNYAYGGAQVVMAPQYDKSIPEDVQFQKATPSGEFKMLVDNPLALEQLKPGKVFYLDLTEVPPPAPA